MCAIAVAHRHQWILEATHPNPRQPLTLINKQGEAPLSQRHMRKTGLIGEIPKYKGGGSKGGGSGQTPRAADANSLFPRLVGGTLMTDQHPSVMLDMRAHIDQKMRVHFQLLCVGVSG